MVLGDVVMWGTGLSVRTCRVTGDGVTDIMRVWGACVELWIACGGGGSGMICGPNFGRLRAGSSADTGAGRFTPETVGIGPVGRAGPML